jgi:ankyrin
MGAGSVCRLGAGVLLAAFASAQAATPVADSAERADWPQVRAQIEAGADVNAAQADGASALIWAAYHGHSEAAGWLLEAGAAVDAANDYGVTATSEAARVGDSAMLARLLAAGADPDARMPEGDTALMLAARSGSVPSVRLLLDAGAAADARDEWHGETALMWAAGENHVDVVRLLAEHDAEIDAVSKAFTWDVKQTGVASQLPGGGLTALLHAAREDALEAAAALLELGANPNAADPHGLSALRVAITNNNLDLAKLLLEHGADADDGALVEAVKLRTLPWVRAAKARTDRTTDLELIELLLARGADVHKVPEVGMVKQHWVDGEHPNEPPLFLAAMGADLELMRLLAARGAVPAESLNSKGASILMAALGLTPHTGPGSSAPTRGADGAVAAGAAALELGADVDAAKNDGMTAVHMAAEKGSDELIRFLVEHGARLDIKDKSNRLAIDVAKGIARIPMAGDEPMPMAVAPEAHESTVALLREAMTAAGVEETPYVDPRPAEDK